MTIGLPVRRVCVVLSLCLILHLVQIDSSQGAIVIDFEDFTLAPKSHLNGPTPDAVTVTNPFGEPEKVGLFMSHGVGFSNSYNPQYGSWSGFAITNETDTKTLGWPANEFSAFAGSGVGGSSNYGVAHGFNDAGFDNSDLNQLRQLPSIYLPENTQVQSAMVTNTTWAALAMEEGYGAADKFGGTSGNEQDYFKLTVFGIGAGNGVLSSSVEFVLADYRFDDSADDYIINRWSTLDLTGLAAAHSLHFSLTSSDNHPMYGMNTPAYFAIDNLTLSAVPEPSGLVLLTCLGLGFAFRRSRAATR